MYIDALELADLRSFASASMRFNHPHRSPDAPLGNVSLIVGLNGSGKTTILRAIALAVMGDTLNSTGFVPRAFVRRHDAEMGATGESIESATLTADLVTHGVDDPNYAERKSTNLEVAPHLLRTAVEIRRHSDREVFESPRRPHSRQLAKHFIAQHKSGLPKANFKAADITQMLYDDRSPSYFLVGYPASRRIENPDAESKSRLPRYDRVAGLFEDQSTLVDLGSWLPQLFGVDPKRFEEVGKIINQLLPEGTTMRGVSRDSVDVLFDHRGSAVPLHALSDGYRSYIGWIGDLLYHLQAVARPKQRLLDMPGVVLIDEIDSHLHPEWQRRVLPEVSTTFKSLQIIATTHSPMVVGTVRAANLIHVKPSYEGNATVANPITTELYGRNANQILLSDLFGLESTRDGDFVEIMRDTASQAAAGDREAASQLSELSAFGIAGADIGSELRDRVDTVTPSPHVGELLRDL